MKTRFIVLAASGTLALAVHAQQVPMSDSGVRTSTDPARAAEVERAAQEMKAREANQPKVFYRGKTDNGLDILSGGISVEDRVLMHRERGAYSLWVATVAKPSGAYLADAKLRIVNLDNQSVALDRAMEGPWLMAALPAGRYEVLATWKGDGSGTDQTLSSRVTVPKTGQRQVVLRFDSSAQVSPDMDGPFQGNPFGSPVVKR